MRFPIFTASNQSISAGLDVSNTVQNSTAIGWTVNAGFRENITPIALTLTNLYTNVSTAPGTGYSRTLKLRANGADTALSVTISDLATTGSATASVQVNQSDLLAVSSSLSSASGASSTLKIGLVFQVNNGIM